MGTSSSADLRLGFGSPELPGASPASITARSASWARAVGGLRAAQASGPGGSPVALVSGLTTGPLEWTGNV